MILAAGYGTRLLPATKSQPKEMLPLVDRPVIHYAVQELVDSGVDQIIIVTALGKRAVEDYFDRSRDIEELLREKGDFEKLDEVIRVSQMADIAYVRQGEPRGIGDAVMTTRKFIGNDPFVLVLPDDVVAHERPIPRQLIEVFDEHQGSVVAVEEVPEAEQKNYGIVAGDRMGDRLTRLRKLIEKPAPGVTDSRLAIVGRYLFTPSVFEAIERTAPGYGGEIQITDAMQLLANEEGMFAYEFEGDRFDTGRPLSLLIANIAMALRRPDIGPDLRRYLLSLELNES